MDTKALKLKCAGCPETDYWRCRSCPTYKLLNRACDLCGRPEAVPLAVSNGKGVVQIYVCRRCHNILV